MSVRPDKIKQLKKLLGHKCFICNTATLAKNPSVCLEPVCPNREKRGEINGVQHLGLKSVIKWALSQSWQPTNRGTSSVLYFAGKWLLLCCMLALLVSHQQLKGTNKSVWSQ